MSSREAAARRAGRLLRWYPKAWRSRYGEEFTDLLISPAIWTSYPQARQANPAAYASATAFAANDAVTHAAALGRRPVRVASGDSDPFYPGVQAFARALPTALVDFGPGCHTASFFAAQEPPSLAFLARHLAS